MSLITALALFGTLGTPELIIILIILLLIFGASKLPQLGGALGKTVKSFKQEIREGAAEATDAKKPGEGGSRFCSRCGAEVADKQAAFCSKCGQAL